MKKYTLILAALLIVNRWGNLMATIEDLNGGWDGKTPNGNDAKEGVYFYKYFAVGQDGSEWVGHGFLTLIRQFFDDIHKIPQAAMIIEMTKYKFGD